MFVKYSEEQNYKRYSNSKLIKKESFITKYSTDILLNTIFYNILLNAR